MKPTVYIETSIVSYLTSWSSNEPIMRGQQEITKHWWRDRQQEFSLFTSQFVLDEAAAGDASAATERLAVLNQIKPIEITAEVVPLAELLLSNGALPPKARVDALHLAISTINGIQYLLTWNCKHLANAMMWAKMKQTCRAAGYVLPSICTPYELMGSNP